MIHDVAHARASLAFRPPLDWRFLLEWLGARAVPGLEAVEDGTYRRVADDGRIAAIALDSGPGLEMRGSAEPATVRRVFDLDHDPAALAAAFAHDPVLGPRLARAPGIRVPGAWSGFELAIRAVLGQQVSVAGARRTAAKLVQELGEPAVEPSAGLSRRFPTPDAVARGPLPGMPQARARALRTLADAVAGGLRLDPPADAAETRAALLALPGIGPWTADYVAMRALHDPDAFLPGDLGVRRGLERLGGPDPERWRPYRAYAVMHLWR
jgi:AraC family transcriptional regulator, regulatory protein of adaptative response / DNA-3-methyladenine glycosylase II